MTNSLNGLVKQVHIGDYGYREWTQQSELRFLEDRFQMPWFAARCHLASIAPHSPDGVWSELSCEMIFSLLNGKKFYMERKVAYISLLFSGYYLNLIDVIYSFSKLLLSRFVMLIEKSRTCFWNFHPYELTWASCSMHCQWFLIAILPKYITLTILSKSEIHLIFGLIYWNFVYCDSTIIDTCIVLNIVETVLLLTFAVIPKSQAVCSV